MHYTWLSIGAQPNVARLEIKQLSGLPGVDHARLTFTFEVTNRETKLVGIPLWFRSRVEVVGIGGQERALNLAPLTAFDRDPVLRDPGSEETFTLAADVENRQLHIIELFRATI